MQFHRLITENFENAKGSCTALIGGGGKTALLHKLASEFAEYNPKVLQTSITKTAFYKSDNPLILKDIDIEIVKNNKDNPLFIIGEKISDRKLLGISESDLDKIRKYFDITIFECDGARNKPLKAHIDYDPTVPNFTSNVIIIVGADVVNTKISDGYVHRPELFCRLWNVSADKIVDIDFIAKIVSSKKGYLSKINHKVKLTYFVNKADKHRRNAKELAKVIYSKSNEPTYYGSIKSNFLEQVS